MGPRMTPRARVRRLLVAAAATWLAGCASLEEEPNGVPSDVYLLPVGNFPREFAQSLAALLSKELGLRVRATLPMGTGGLAELPRDDQLDAADLIDKAHAVGTRLRSEPGKFAVIALTTRDINEAPQSLRFIFSKNDIERRTSVISIAHMLGSTPKVEGTPSQRRLRLYKMVKRCIGEQYYGLPRSARISDVMYAPIMSLEDIDAMGVEFAAKGLR